MELTFHDAGPMVTVQDLGRYGYRRFGVSPAGPMDAPAFALATALCANPAGAAGVEFAGPLGRITATRDLRFAVVARGARVMVGGRMVAEGESHTLRAGEVLSVSAPRDCLWGYLSVDGGVDVPPVLGSRATHLRSGLGPARITAGTRLPLGPARTAPCLMAPVALPVADGPIRITLGPQATHFAPEVLARLTGERFTITPQRDRRACVLDGPALPAMGGHDIVSDGTVAGSIQVPASGRAVVLMAEAQTTGGYPKIATVISADLPRLAQMTEGAEVRFMWVSGEEAEEAAISQARALATCLAALRPKGGMMDSTYLLGHDLVGGIFDAGEVVGRKRGLRQFL